MKNVFDKMLLYQPSSPRRDLGGKLNVGGGGQVLDLETVVKYGILGGDGSVLRRRCRQAIGSPSKISLRKLFVMHD